LNNIENDNNLKFIIFVVIEESEKEIYKKLFKESLEKHPIEFQLLILKNDEKRCIGIGKKKNFISYFAEVTNISFYHVVDDDLDFMEFDPKSKTWVNHSTVVKRALFFNQWVMFNETYRSTNEIVDSIYDKFCSQNDLVDEECICIGDKNMRNKLSKIIHSIDDKKRSQKLILELLETWNQICDYLKENAPIIFELIYEEKNRLKRNVGQVAVHNKLHDGNRGQSKSQTCTLSAYVDNLLKLEPVTHQIKDTIYQVTSLINQTKCIFCNAEATKGIYSLSDEWFFKKPLQSDEFKVAVKERQNFEKIAFPKVNVKNPLHFTETNFCGLDSTKYADFICRGYYSEDKILVYKLAKHGFDSFSAFKFLIQDKFGYPSVCNGNVDKTKNLEPSKVDEFIEQSKLEEELENEYEPVESDCDSE
jgi:hypothetical protein